MFAGPMRLLRASGEPRLLSCWSDTDVSLLDARGGSAFDVQLPARGHGIALNQQQDVAAVFARRPGDFVWIIDLRDGKLIEKITAAQGRHYYGHGVFTPDRKYLLCSENAFAESTCYAVKTPLHQARAVLVSMIARMDINVSVSFQATVLVHMKSSCLQMARRW